MSDQIKVFWIEPNGMQRRWLRRYSMRGCCTVNNGYKQYCSSKFHLYDCPKDQSWPEFKKENAQWPLCCEKCDKPFEDDDARQQFSRDIYVRPDTGETFTLEDAPVGACWNAPWYTDGEYNKGKQGSGYNTGPDGRCLVVKLPDGYTWMIDSRCSNCGRPDDNEHFCWVRHGRPEDGTLHVDKNGNTCAAGAGSIQTKEWHGFLRNGYLVT